MKIAPQVPAIPGMTPLGITPRRPDGTILPKPKLPRPIGEPIRRPSKPKPKRPRKPKPPKATHAPSMVPEAALATCDLFRAELMRRNPYIMAKDLFVAGHLLQGQAAALAVTDGDFQAECRYQHKDAREEATRIVRDVWSRELVANMTTGRAT